MMSLDGCVLHSNYETLTYVREFIIGAILAVFWVAAMLSLVVCTVVEANQQTNLIAGNRTNRLIKKSVKQSSCIFIIFSVSVYAAFYVTHFNLPLDWPS